MADEKKISGLTEATDVSASDEFVVVNKDVVEGQDASASGQTSKITLDNLRNAILGGSGGPQNDAKLHVDGTIISTSNTAASWNADNAGFDRHSGTSNMRIFNTSTTDDGGMIDFYVGRNLTGQANAGSVTHAMRIDSGGNVGIGTGSPSKKLTVNGGVHVLGNNKIHLSDAPDQVYIQAPEANKFRICTNDIPRMTIDEAGRVGINRRSPLHTLDVAGNARIGNGDDRTPTPEGTNSHLQINGAGYSGLISLDAEAMWVGHNSIVRDLHLMTDEKPRMTIKYNGNVGIGITDPQYKFEVDGRSVITHTNNSSAMVVAQERETTNTTAGQTWAQISQRGHQGTLALLSYHATERAPNEGTGMLAGEWTGIDFNGVWSRQKKNDAGELIEETEQSGFTMGRLGCRAPNINTKNDGTSSLKSEMMFVTRKHSGGEVESATLSDEYFQVHSTRGIVTPEVRDQPYLSSQKHYPKSGIGKMLTDVAIPRSSPGWYDIVRFKITDNGANVTPQCRGGGTYTISYTGGSFRPISYEIDYYKSYDGHLQVTGFRRMSNASINSYIHGVRAVEYRDRSDANKNDRWQSIQVYLKSNAPGTDGKYPGHWFSLYHSPRGYSDDMNDVNGANNVFYPNSYNEPSVEGDIGPGRLLSNPQNNGHYNYSDENGYNDLVWPGGQAPADGEFGVTSAFPHRRMNVFGNYNFDYVHMQALNIESKNSNGSRLIIGGDNTNTANGALHTGLQMGVFNGTSGLRIKSYTQPTTCELIGGRYSAHIHTSQTGSNLAFSAGAVESGINGTTDRSWHMKLDPSGNLYLGADANKVTTDSANLLINGEIYNRGLDADFVENNRPAEIDALEKIKNVSVSEYEVDGQTKLGVLAQDVAEILPHSVRNEEEYEAIVEDARGMVVAGHGTDEETVYAEDVTEAHFDSNKEKLPPEAEFVETHAQQTETRKTSKSVSQTELIATLVKAVQELSAKVDELSK